MVEGRQAVQGRLLGPGQIRRQAELRGGGHDRIVADPAVGGLDAALVEQFGQGTRQVAGRLCVGQQGAGEGDGQAEERDGRRIRILPRNTSSIIQSSRAVRSSDGRRAAWGCLVPFTVDLRPAFQVTGRSLDLQDLPRGRHLHLADLAPLVLAPDLERILTVELRLPRLGRTSPPAAPWRPLPSTRGGADPAAPAPAGRPPRRSPTPSAAGTPAVAVLLRIIHPRARIGPGISTHRPRPPRPRRGWPGRGRSCSPSSTSGTSRGRRRRGSSPRGRSAGCRTG